MGRDTGAGGGEASNMRLGGQEAGGGGIGPACLPEMLRFHSEQTSQIQRGKSQRPRLSQA